MNGKETGMIQQQDKRHMKSNIKSGIDFIAGEYKKLI